MYLKSNSHETENTTATTQNIQTPRSHRPSLVMDIGRVPHAPKGKYRRSLRLLVLRFANLRAHKPLRYPWSSFHTLLSTLKIMLQHHLNDVRTICYIIVIAGLQCFGLCDSKD